MPQVLAYSPTSAWNPATTGVRSNIVAICEHGRILYWWSVTRHCRVPEMGTSGYEGLMAKPPLMEVSECPESWGLNLILGDLAVGPGL